LTDLELLGALAASAPATLSSYKGIAILYSPQSGRVTGVGLHEPADAMTTYQTAIANILHRLTDEHVGNDWCVSNYHPTPICEGIANVRQLKPDQIVEVSGGRIVGTARGTDFGNPVKSGAALPDWKTKPKEFFDALMDAAKDKRLQPKPQLIAETFNTAPYSTQRGLPEDVLQTFSTLPSGPAPAANSLGWQADELYLRLAFALVGQTWNPVVKWVTQQDSGERYGGNNVGAVITLNDRIIGWGVNLAAQNRTLHAETLSILAYLQSTGAAKLPKGCKVYSSLQPCKMCAAHIAQLGQDVDVVIGMKDAGLTTILDKNRINGCSERLGELRQNMGQIKSAVPAVNLSITKPSIHKQLSAQPSFGKAASTKLLNSKDDEALRKNKKFGTPSALGNSFVQYTDWFVAQRKLSWDKLPETKKALDQCIGLLKIVAVKGLTTSYGLGFVLPLLDEIYGEQTA
jgi:tRNA(Arg) A34 adenosine deaminase TadA